MARSRPPKRTPLPSSSLAVYLGFSQDVCDMSAALSQATPDFDTALEIYQTGKNSPSRRGGYRSLKGESFCPWTLDIIKSA